jgi:tyrosyl-tRNA synthetase
MSKSLGNYIGITEPPSEMYGKAMSIPDEIMRRYFELCTDIDMAEVDRRLREDHPRDNKRSLARELVRIYHGEDAAKAADDEFVRVFSQKGVPDEMPTVTIPRAELENGGLFIVKLLVAAKLAPSNKEARRKVEQGAVSLNGEKVSEVGDVALSDGDILKVGRHHARVQLK